MKRSAPSDWGPVAKEEPIIRLPLLTNAATRHHFAAGPLPFALGLAWAAILLVLLSAVAGQADELLDPDADGLPGSAEPSGGEAVATSLGASTEDGPRVLFYELELHSGYFSIDIGYRLLANLLRDRGYSVSALTTAITLADLADVDVLVVAVPHNFLTASEISSIVDFVSSGGGLFLISDYHQVETTSISQITFEFGIRNFSGSVRDPSDHDSHEFWPIIHVFGSHPIVSDIPSVTFRAGSYLIMSPGSPAVGIAFSDGDSRPANAAVMVATPECSAERLVVIGDATLFAGVPFGDNERELALNSVDWLAGRLAPCVEIDIKPGSEANPLNANANGVVPVAILGSSHFDVDRVDVSTLAFGPAGAAPAHGEGGHSEDVNDDGFSDLISHYRTREAGIALGATQACVMGETFDRMPFEACDQVRTVPACGLGFELGMLLPAMLWLRLQRRRRSH